MRRALGENVKIENGRSMVWLVKEAFYLVSFTTRIAPISSSEGHRNYGANAGVRYFWKIDRQTKFSLLLVKGDEMMLYTVEMIRACMGQHYATVEK